MLSMEKALPGQVGTFLRGEPWQLLPGPMSLLLPITAPEVVSRVFYLLIQDSCWALTKEGRKGQNQVPEDWKAWLFFSFPAHERSGISLTEKKCSLYFINYTPDPHPQTKQNKTKLVMLFVQMVRPGSYRSPTSSSLSPAEGMGFVSVIFLYGNVWFGVRDFVSQRERECVEVDLIKIGISYI